MNDEQRRDPGSVHRSSFRVHRSAETVAETAQVMLSHQRLEDIRPREQSKSFSEARFPSELRKLRFIRERPRLQLVHAEEVTELGVLLKEDRARLPDRVLPPRERVDVHRVI